MPKVGDCVTAPARVAFATGVLVRKLAVMLGVAVVSLAWPAASSGTVAFVLDGSVRVSGVPGTAVASLGALGDLNVDPIDVHVTRPDFGPVVHVRENVSVIAPLLGCSYAVVLQEVTCQGGSDPGFGTGVLGGIHADRISTGPFPVRSQGPGIFSPTVGIASGAGNDVITSAGASRIDAGDGDDVIEADNGTTNEIHCGNGHDRANVDAWDEFRVFGCEIVE